LVLPYLLSYYALLLFAEISNMTEIGKKLWATADSLRANSRLKASEYSVPVLGLIFLRFADYRFTQVDLEWH